jgi:hypothetical protein
MSMGYRSTVAYTIRFIPVEQEGIDFVMAEERARGSFFTFIAEAKSKDTVAGAFLDEEHFKVDEENLTIYFFADSVKWYESYEDVQCHECLMGLSREWAEDGDCSSPYIGGVFVRIGEELEDMVQEVWGEGDYDWIRINRTMHCDWLE